MRYRKIRTTSMRANRTQMMMPIMIPTTVPATELSLPDDGSTAVSPSQEGEYTSVKVYAASHAWSDAYTK